MRDAVTFLVDFEPLGRRIPCEAGGTLLDAAQRAGIGLNATCGGEGSCGRCIVRVMTGKASAPNLVEEAELGVERTRLGWRLACQTEVQGDLSVHIPAESLVTAQRIQVEGQDLAVELRPAVRSVEVKLDPPGLNDLRSDADRLRDALGLPELSFPASVLRLLPGTLRSNDFRCTVFLRGDQAVGLGPLGSVPLGLAVDLGTTKLAGYLLDLSDGRLLASAGLMNPQIAFGEDVMARLAHAMNKPDGADQLREAVCEAVNDLARLLCEQAGRLTEHVADAVLVGNTAMHHLFLGLEVRQLGLAPYVPAEAAALDLPAREAGVRLAPGAWLHLLPNVAGFVGGDHVSMLLGSGMPEREGVVLGLDIGTNTEISLLAGGRHYACSTASGPAFEGAHIRHGMRAAPGAIEKVLIRDGRLSLQTIEDGPPVGLCGSGILDLVAQLRKSGLITSRGGFDKERSDPRLRQGEVGLEYVLSEVGGTEVTFNRRDVNEIQLAKSAMRTGMNILLRRAGLREQDIDTVILAGAFGTYLDVQSGIDIGMFPNLPRERYLQVGNAAGAGARMALLNMLKREQAADIARRVTYVELTAEKDFSTIFARSLLLDPSRN